MTTQPTGSPPSPGKQAPPAVPHLPTPPLPGSRMSPEERDARARAAMLQQAAEMPIDVHRDRDGALRTPEPVGNAMLRMDAIFTPELIDRLNMRETLRQALVDRRVLCETGPAKTQAGGRFA